MLDIDISRTCHRDFFLLSSTLFSLHSQIPLSFSLYLPHLSLSLTLGLCRFEAGVEVQTLLLQLLLLLQALLSNCKRKQRTDGFLTKNYGATVFRWSCVTHLFESFNKATYIIFIFDKPFSGYLVEGSLPSGKKSFITEWRWSVWTTSVSFSFKETSEPIWGEHVFGRF